MDDRTLREKAALWLNGTITREEFLSSFREMSFQAWGDVALDVDRADRCGFPEVVFGEGKPVAVLCEILSQFRQRREPLLITRIEDSAAIELNQREPLGIYNKTARTWRWSPVDLEAEGKVVVVSAGTTDRPIAEEAVETLHWMSVDVELIQDIGVAGPQRLLNALPKLTDAQAIVVVAGMEGALPSVVGGHVGCPVIAVPTSVGYGAAFEGVAALLGMLNSCAANVTVVNIDAGFKAGYVAGLIARNSLPRSLPTSIEACQRSS